MVNLKKSRIHFGVIALLTAFALVTRHALERPGSPCQGCSGAAGAYLHAHTRAGWTDYLHCQDQ